MPVLSKGYEAYRGSIASGRSPLFAISSRAIRRNLRWWVWLLFAACLVIGSALWYVAVLLVYGGPAMIPSFGGKPPTPMVAMLEDPYFYPNLMDWQFLWAAILGTVVGAGEIAEDLRTGALAFYLGRPVTRRDYVLGKVLAVAATVLAVTLFPSLLLFAIHAMFEGSFRWLVDHARVPLAMIGTGVVQAVFVSCFVLGLSALAQRRRWATVTVAAVFLGLIITAQVVAVRVDQATWRELHQLEQRLENAESPDERKAIRTQMNEKYDALGSISTSAGLRCISPWACIAAAERDLFGNPLPSNFSGGRHWLVLAGISGALGTFLWRRVRAVEIVT